MSKESLLGGKIEESFTMKLCCDVCGFPVELPRKPVLLDSNVCSLLEYEHNTCLSCGHQADGSSIPVVYEHWQRLCNKFIKERTDLFKFLNHFFDLTLEQRKGVCIELPRFLRKRDGDLDDGLDPDGLEPYSWNVVYIEVLADTKLGRIMVRDIDWTEVERNA